MADSKSKNHSRGPQKSKRATGKANQRTLARLNVVQALYQMDVGDADLAETRAQFSARLAGGEVDGEKFLPGDADFFNQILSGVLKHQLTIDPLIDRTLTDAWPVERIDTTLRAILRAGAFELVYRSDIPTGVVVSEYIEISRAFFEGEVPAMVNAILDNIARSRGETATGAN